MKCLKLTEIIRSTRYVSLACISVERVVTPTWTRIICMRLA